jgi:hypothetical protein
MCETFLTLKVMDVVVRGLVSFVLERYSSTSLCHIIFLLIREVTYLSISH